MSCFLIPGSATPQTTTSAPTNPHYSLILTNLCPINLNSQPKTLICAPSNPPDTNSSTRLPKPSDTDSSATDLPQNSPKEPAVDTASYCSKSNINTLTTLINLSPFTKKPLPKQMTHQLSSKTYLTADRANQTFNMSVLLLAPSRMP
jgi:hypothetical protein